MVMRRTITVVLVLLLLAICAASAFSLFPLYQWIRTSGMRFSGLNIETFSAEATEDKVANVNGPVSLRVENDFGDITVSPGTDGQVSIHSVKKGWGSSQADADAALKEVTVVIEQTGNRVQVSVKRPSQVGGIQIGNHGSSVAFTISAPVQTAAILYSANGDVSLNGVTGKADLSSSFGKLDVSRVTGDVHAKTSNGAVTASDITGAAKISLESEFGSISLTNAQAGEISATTNNGAVTLDGFKAAQNLTLNSEFGDIDARQGEAASADVHSSNGAIRLEKLTISGPVTVKSSFGGVTLDAVSAQHYDLKTDNGKISAFGVDGAIKAHSSFGEVEVLDAQQAVLDLSSENGALTFSGTLGKGDQLLKSSMGSIDMTIQPDAALNVDLQTSFGKVKSDFAISISGEVNANHWLGSINGGGDRLTITTQNGNINLKKSK